MPEPQRVGVLGGTFDPLHIGHLLAASEVHDELRLDVVVLVPAGRPWQKNDDSVTSAEHRVRMTELAVENDERMQVSRVDVDRAGPTYSIDTVRDLRRQFGQDAELFLLAGADALAGMSAWHEVAHLLEDVVVVGFERRGHALEVPSGLPAERFVFAPTTAVDVSSTLVRERARAGASIRYLVPEPVEHYIRATGLYRAAA